MLSTLNHYQRIRKHNDELVLKMEYQDDAVLFLLKENTKFSSQLPFEISFLVKGKQTVYTLIKSRELFDEEFIRKAINSTEQQLLKGLVNSYIEIEETFFKENS